MRSVVESLARDPAALAIRYVAAPYITERGLIAISAAPGVGKGKVTQDLLIARATWQTWLGVSVAEGPALWWSGEQGADEDDRVFAALARGRGIIVEDFKHPLIIVSEPPGQLSDGRLFARVLELARQHPGLLIALDSLRRVFPGDDVDSQVSDRFYRTVAQPLRQAGATVVLLCHPPKPPAQGDLRAESLIRGSGDWLAILDSFLILKAAGRQRLDPVTEEIHATLVHVKARRGPKGEGGTVTLRVDFDGTPSLAFALSLKGGGTEVTKAQLALEALADFYREHGQGSRQDYLRHFDGRFSERQLDPARKTLVAQGLLQAVDAETPGKRSLWRWIEVPGGVDAGYVPGTEPGDDDA
jgi:AAA domain